MGTTRAAFLGPMLCSPALVYFVLLDPRGMLRQLYTSWSQEMGVGVDCEEPADADRQTPLAAGLENFTTASRDRRPGDTVGM